MIEVIAKWKSGGLRGENFVFCVMSEKFRGIDYIKFADLKI